jgi:hypothetical protein
MCLLPRATLHSDSEQSLPSKTHHPAALNTPANSSGLLLPSTSPASFPRRRLVVPGRH